MRPSEVVAIGELSTRVTPKGFVRRPFVVTALSSGALTAQDENGPVEARHILLLLQSEDVSWSARPQQDLSLLLEILDKSGPPRKITLRSVQTTLW